MYILHSAGVIVFVSLHFMWASFPVLALLYQQMRHEYSGVDVDCMIFPVDTSRTARTQGL